jgi:DtxR family Mn-dependent transcriptional regulator
MPNARRPKPQPTASPTGSNTESVENFLKAVYTLQQAASDGGRISTNALADHLGVKAPSVTDMARRMVESGMIDYQRYYGVRLTTLGITTALTVIRRHRLIELYLVQELGYLLHEVHAEAERLEHAVSDQFITAIEHKLGFPEIDPHGDPIPSAEGYIAEASGIPLTELPTGALARVSRLNTPNADLLKYLVSRDIKLGDPVMVHDHEPFDGPLTVSISGQRHILGHKAAACIMVEADQ